MKTTKWSAILAGLLLGVATVSFGQVYGPGYGQAYPNGNGYNPNPTRMDGNGYGQNYPNPNYPNGYNNGYGQSYPNGNGYKNYPNAYGQYDQYIGYPLVQPPVVSSSSKSSNCSTSSIRRASSSRSALCKLRLWARWIWWRLPGWVWRWPWRFRWS
jgi:hypothetical protein